MAVSSLVSGLTVDILSTFCDGFMAVSLLVSGVTVDILSTFCDGFMVQCVKLMLTIFFRQNVTCMKRFKRYGHYAGEVEDIIIGRLA